MTRKKLHKKVINFLKSDCLYWREGEDLEEADNYITHKGCKCFTQENYPVSIMAKLKKRKWVFYKSYDFLCNDFKTISFRQFIKYL